MAKIMTNAESVVVLDFETTGLSPNQGDRAIEIGAVKIESGEIANKFQMLMNPGCRINSFIESYTGITNKMLKNAPPCGEVMGQFRDFIGDNNLVAHNASFDSKFLDAELSRIKNHKHGQFVCSMLISRRVYPNAPNHKLGTLVSYKKLPNDGTFHRALADAQMTAHLWLAIINDIKSKYSFNNIPFDMMQELSRISKISVPGFLRRQSVKFR